jgi:4-cresol dehydrogenase (hydroxylating)
VTGVSEQQGTGASDAVAVAAVLEAARTVVGDCGVLPAPNGANVSMFAPRRVHAVVRPATVDQVRAVVRLFADPGVPCGLQAVSTGRNWGLGSAEPAGDDVVRLELAGLDRIRGLDLDGGWAVVEPGVTQGRLAAELAGTPRMLNMTAAAADTSVVGNALDRGMGVRRQRVDDVAGLEVVLPDGGLVRVGWWPREQTPTAVYTHGLGPSLAPLFSQSDLGVVTAAAIRLLPRPEAQRIVRIAFSAPDVREAVDELRRLAAQGLTTGVLKIYDPVSAANYGGQAGQFLAFVDVSGTVELVEALSTVLDGEVGRSRVLEILKDDGSAPDAVAAMLHGAHHGDPAGNDAMLLATLGADARHVDERGRGWLFFMPMVPFCGTAVARAHQLLDRIAERTGVRPGSTFNGLGSDVVDFVVTVKFDRAPEPTARAHHVLDTAFELFTAAGFIPYRLDVDHAHWIDQVDPDSGARALARRLKTLLDPHGAIAPGRYA